MDLVEQLETIKKGIREGKFSNEASVSQGIVLRILQALEWPNYDTQTVIPEFPIEGRRVDFALCYPTRQPQVLIEVKMIGKNDGAERQLFEYAFHLGIPMAILTDGSEWHFFLPTEVGSYAERRVYKLDLLERETDELVDRLNRYLHFDRVRNREALNDARKDYLDVARERKVNETLPLAWKSLINEPDDFLVELIIEKVESLCGYRPTESKVSNFLADREIIEDTDEGIQEEQISEQYKSPFSCVDRDALPAGLADVLEVCLEVYENGNGYNAAVRELYQRRGLRSIHTIYDKCTRSLDLDTEGFKELLSRKDQISNYLKERYPEYSEQIDSCL